MIQDIFPKKFNNQFQNKNAKDSDTALVFAGRNILIRAEENDAEFPTVAEVRELVESVNYIFSIDEKDYYLGVSDDRLELPGYEYIPMNKLRSYKDKDEILAGATGYHLDMWYKANRFCGRCGKPTVHDSKERMLRCECCNNMIFPKIAPAVIVGLTCGDKIMLTTYSNREYKRYALIAGFTEIGESAEETVAREVLEEVGLKVKNVRYYKSQPWGFDSNLLLGFFADVDMSEGEDEIVMDTEELASAEWVSREDVPDYGENLSLTHEMMVQFKKGMV